MHVWFNSVKYAVMHTGLFAKPQNEGRTSDSVRFQVVQDRETCLAEAHKMVSTMMKIPSEARHVSKMLMRQETLDRLTKNKEADIEHFATFITQPVIQKPLGKYLEALKAKSKKK